MNAEQCTDAVMEYLGDRLAAAAGEYVEELVEQVKADLSVPVQRIGNQVVRSKPGERPRADTREYRESWEGEVDRAGDRITCRAGTTSELGPMLEYGTDRMAARPHAGPAAERARREAAVQIQNNLRTE